MPVIGGPLLAKNFVKYTERFLKEVNVDMTKVSSLIEGAVKVNAGVSDHSSKDLADLGHPYAKRSPNPPHNPEWLVHKQSGALLRAVYKGTNPASINSGTLTASAFCGVDEFMVPYARYLVFGTSKMIPRNFLRGSLNDVAYDAKEILRRSLNGVTVSFDGERTKL